MSAHLPGPLRTAGRARPAPVEGILERQARELLEQQAAERRRVVRYVCSTARDAADAALLLAVLDLDPREARP